MNVSKRYLFGMLSGAGSVVLKTALNLIVIPLLIGKLGLDVFGLHILLISILEISLLLDLGASNALVKLIGGSQKEAQKQAYLQLGQIIFGGIAILYLLIGLGLSPWFNTCFHIHPNLMGITKLGLPLTLLEAAIVIYSCYYQAVLLSHCSHQWSNIADSIHALLTSIGTVFLLVTGFGLLEIITLRLVSTMLRLGLMVYQAYRIESTIFQLNNPIDKASFMEVVTLCSYSLTLNLSVIISHKIDAFIIAFFLPISAVGLYDIVFRMFGITIQICLKMSAGSFPLFAKMATEKALFQAKQHFLKLSQFLCFSASFMLLIILSHYAELFKLFSASQIPIQKTIPIVWIAVPCILSGVLQMPACSWLFTWGYQAYLTRSSLLVSTCNLILSIILVHFLGVLGVGLGTLIPQLIQHQAGLIRTVCQKLNITFMEYLKTVHFKVVFPILAAGIWIHVCRILFPLKYTGWSLVIQIGLNCLGALVVSLCVLLFLYDFKSEKRLRYQSYILKMLLPLKLNDARKQQAEHPVL